MRVVSIATVAAALLAVGTVERIVAVQGAAQGRGQTAPGGQAAGQGRGDTPQTAQAAAPIDLTGWWVSVVTEDWRWRMVTPAKGDYSSVPINAEGRRVADAWDPAKDEREGNACRAYGVAGIMRVPGRVHITWDNSSTLKIETDAGTQTRLLHFGETARAAGEQGWQGYSVATWEIAGGQIGRGAPGGGRGAGGGVPAAAAPRYGSLKVVTTGMKPGYLRKNGVPYSENAVVTEYFDRHTESNGDEWFTVTTIVDDPKYLNQPFITSTGFKKERDGSKWRPTPCTAS
jgi:hypothetical protein